MNQKLTRSDLIEIDRLKREQNLSNAKLGEMFGVSPPGIHRALKRYRGEAVRPSPSAEGQRIWRKQRTDQTVAAVVIHQEAPAENSTENLRKAKRLDFMRFRLAKLKAAKEQVA